MTKYVVEPIGAQFAGKDIDRLASKFEIASKDGYELHSVFQVTQPGCLGLGQPSATYLAIFKKDE